MISIKRFLNQDGQDVVLWQVVSLLLEKIGSDAVQADRSEFEAFGSNIKRIRESLSDSASEYLLLNAESAVQAMTDYNQRVSKFIHRQGSEIQNVVAMLTDTVVKMSGGNTRFARSFQEIGDSLDSTPGTVDLQNLKLRLRKCLQEFQEETLQQKAEMEKVITTLQLQVEGSRNGCEMPMEDPDPATGLPQQRSAEAAMVTNLKAGPRTYVATLVVNRMQSINARFGYQVGDRVLRTFREKIEKQLSPRDKMFRWAGPAIVVLIDRPESLEIVREHLKRILDAKFEETFELPDRSVLIPISASWSAFKLISPVSLAIKQIQSFIASQSCRDFV